MDDLYLTLPSNTGDFAQNTLSSFEVKLPYRMELDGDWQLGLCEIQYPHSWDSIKGGQTVETQDNWILISLKTKKPNKERLIAISIPTGFYSGIVDFIGVINNTVAERKDEIVLKDVFKLFYDPVFKRVKLKLDNDIVKGVILGQTIQYMLGFGVDKMITFRDSVTVAKYPPDITSGFNTLYVYCDLIQPQIVGNVLAPLLRTVPISGDYGSTCNKVFLSPHYLPLRKKSFDTVEIAIRDDTDHPVEFMFGKVIVKLHLKRK